MGKSWFMNYCIVSPYCLWIYYYCILLNIFSNVKWMIFVYVILFKSGSGSRSSSRSSWISLFLNGCFKKPFRSQLVNGHCSVPNQIYDFKNKSLINHKEKQKHALRFLWLFHCKKVRIYNISACGMAFLVFTDKLLGFSSLNSDFCFI